MNTTAVVLQEPEKLTVSRVALEAAGEADLEIDVEWSGISTGTERLLFNGRMPAFPGMGYPLVPGYEAVGRVAKAGAGTLRTCGERVFVPGSHGFADVHCLFGGAAAKLVVHADKVVPVPESAGDSAVLLALAATAWHALAAPGATPPDLIVGHGVLGRLLARLSILRGNPPPVVWEREAQRARGAAGYPVLLPDMDDRRDYQSVYDVSGDADLLDTLIGRLARGGEIVLAGFYSDRLSFAYPAAFVREARLRISAEWSPPDLEAVSELLASGRLELADLVSHRQAATHAAEAYRTAFHEPDCLKMILDWRDVT